MRRQLLRYSIIILSILGLLICVAMLFPQVRQIILNFAEQILQREASTYQSWLKVLLSYALGGICFILLFDFCTLTVSGKQLVRNITNEIRDGLSEIDFRSLIKPAIFMFGVYLLGVITLFRANFLYYDDVGRAMAGYRGWYGGSRYLSDFFSIFVHADTNLTDISPLPQLLAIFLLAISSVLLVYVLCDKKITIIRLLASVPLGLSPYIMECLSYKFDSPYMALSVLVSIVPFLFIARKKAFIFCSVVSLLCMYMTYQAASGIYILIVLVLCFQYWNEKQKMNKEIYLFIIRAIFSYGLAMIVFKLFLMKPLNTYASDEMFSLHQFIPGFLGNLKNYFGLLFNDFNPIWIIFILFILIFFIAKSLRMSRQKKVLAFLGSIFLIALLFVFSYGLYLALSSPLFAPRALYGFGVLLAILSIYTVYAYKKIAVIPALALSWCFFTFAFSYGNALADQMRYVNFRAGILLHDLSALYPNRANNEMTFQLKNKIGFTPIIKNIAKHNPVIERLVPCMLEQDEPWANGYYLTYFNFGIFSLSNLPLNMKNGEPYIDFDTVDLPVVLESFYHTIKSDGNHVLVILKE